MELSAQPQTKQIISSQSMNVTKMKQVLEKTGVVESNSPKNRKLLYKLLQKEHIPFYTKVIGYTGGTKTLNPNACNGKRTGLGYDLGRVTKWIYSKRILKDDLKKACETAYSSHDFKSIESAFDEGLTMDEIRTILRNGWGDKKNTSLNNTGSKYGPLDSCALQKTIVRITLEPQTDNDTYVCAGTNEDDWDIEICI